VHSRVCERLLNAPAKTGLPGCVKPANYTKFVEFAIQVFDAFEVRGWKRFNPDTWHPGDPVVVESFPLAAWRSLRLPSLPAKHRARDKDICSHLEHLVGAGLIASNGQMPTHDQLQALVAGLAGLGIEARAEHRFEAVGAPPFTLDGAWREGYIVNPRRQLA
jgi:hypothetical protein